MIFLKLNVYSLEKRIADDRFARVTEKNIWIMKNFTAICRLFVVGMTLLACDPGGGFEAPPEDNGGEMGHGMIVLGEKLENPYAVRNITRALDKLYPTRADREDLMPTDRYVRFLPKDGQQYERLLSLGLLLSDYPLDYRIVRDGDYYQDPAIPEGELTWQYAVVPPDLPLPEGIRVEILDDCFIPETGTRSNGIDWDAVEREAYALTGNARLYREPTRAGKTCPKGRICIVDDDLNGGKPFGVAGVTVLCNSFVKFSTATTDRDGYYEMSKGYDSQLRYRLLFRNVRGFSIGFNLLLLPASTSALGKAGPEGLDCTVTTASENKLFARAAVNNAVYDYYSRCSSEDLDIPTPPDKLRIWLFHNLNVSSCPMLRHGAMVEDGVISEYLGKYVPLLELFLPDVTIGVKGNESYSGLYAAACHEMAHASHYTRVGNSYWNKYIGYVLKSFAKSRKLDYGDGTSEDAGYCAIGEMWAYFLQDRMWNDRYGGNAAFSGLNWWFRPQIFSYLNDRRFTASMIFQGLQSDIHGTEALRSRLKTLYPSESSLIDQAFARYDYGNED